MSPDKTVANAESLKALVIVLNWNQWEYTFDCLRSLRDAADVSCVWLVDNASTLDRSQEARQLAPGLRVVRLDENYGFAGGMNRAMRLAAGEGYRFAYLLNNDCIVQTGFLQAALDVVQSSPDASVVGSRIAYADSTNSVFFDGEYYQRNRRSIEKVFDIKRTAHANGAGMLIRLAPLERCGYFDERYFCYHEEVELCWRLGVAGFSSLVAGGSLIHHHRGGSNIEHNALYYRTRNRFLLAERFQGWLRLKERFCALYEAGLVARAADCRSNPRQWRVMAAAVHDGLRRRFGKRSPSGSLIFAQAQLRVLCGLVPVVDWLLPGISALADDHLLASLERDSEKKQAS